MQYTAFMVVNYLGPWYGLTLEERIQFEHEQVFPAVGAFVKAGAEIRPTRAIGFGASAESFFVMRFDEMDVYLDLVRALRSSRLITDGYAEIQHEFVGVDEAYFAERDRARLADDTAA